MIQSATTYLALHVPSSFPCIERSLCRCFFFIVRLWEYVFGRSWVLFFCFFSGVGSVITYLKYYYYPYSLLQLLSQFPGSGSVSFLSPFCHFRARTFSEVWCTESWLWSFSFVSCHCLPVYLSATLFSHIIALSGFS
jgi:hypothetical protein